MTRSRPLRAYEGVLVWGRGGGLYLLVGLVLGLPVEADVLDQPGLDVLVVHELAEDVELLAEELVGEVHLREEREGPGLRCAPRL